MMNITNMIIMITISKAVDVYVFGQAQFATQKRAMKDVIVYKMIYIYICIRTYL